ncbi:MAG: hypothetical protein V7719_12665 [Psychroserpens sp.]|uniref:hypothetical protein n=1 Tax=Psychroserpens sp. TaxID=2020870 RepID=UPI0030033CF7
MIKTIRNLKQITYCSFDGNISFFASKSFSRQPLQNKFEIRSFLEGYSIQMSLFKKNKDENKDVISLQSIPKIQFIGELLEFDYSELSESESTVVFKGDIKVLCTKKENTFLGSIKKINDTIFLKANFSLDTSEFEFEKVLNCSTLVNSAKAVSVEIMLQLKA